MVKQHKCTSCGKHPLVKDEVAASKRLLGADISSYFCIQCLAENTGFEMDELLARIEELKEQGCKFFD